MDDNGKLVIFPSSSGESYRGARNPADVVAGLSACLDFLPALNETLALLAKRLNTPQQPVIKGTRISVELILEWMASGANRDEIVGRHPHLSADDVEQALAFAASSFKNDVLLKFL